LWRETLTYYLQPMAQNASENAIRHFYKAEQLLVLLHLLDVNIHHTFVLLLVLMIDSVYAASKLPLYRKVS
jgi:hypothetical protein